MVLVPCINTAFDDEAQYLKYIIILVDFYTDFYVVEYSIIFLRKTCPAVWS
jgi:hypothetical protein